MRCARWLLCAVTLAASLAAASPAVAQTGTLSQLGGTEGCFVDASSARAGCTSVRGLAGASPFTGSNAVAVTPDGRNVYVAAADDNAIAVLQRSPATGELAQPSGPGGCVAQNGSSSCARGPALRTPTSVAVSPDGQNVYVAAMRPGAVVAFARSGGALRQIGCVSAAPLPGCVQGTALGGADVVAVSPDGRNVYAGAFGQAAVAVFARDPDSGALTQAGCIAEAIDGCAPALGLGGVEGLAVSPDGGNVYVGAAIANAVAVLNRDRRTGALTQAPAPGGCLVSTAASGCTTVQGVGGADAIAVSPDGASVYVAGGLQDALAVFARDQQTGGLAQLQGTDGCILAKLAQGCALGRAFSDPEGVAVSPDGQSVYVGAFASSAIDTFDRDADTGVLTQPTARSGCIVARRNPLCRPGRALGGANGVAVSADGANVYVGANRSDALAAFAREDETAPGSD